MLNSRYTWINGQMLETAQANIPLLTSGFHYGIGIFEGIRAYQAGDRVAVFRLREHMVRFEQSGKILGFTGLGYTVDEMVTIVADTVRKNGYGDCYGYGYGYGTITTRNARKNGYENKNLNGLLKKGGMG